MRLEPAGQFDIHRSKTNLEAKFRWALRLSSAVNKPNVYTSDTYFICFPEYDIFISRSLQHSSSSQIFLQEIWSLDFQLKNSWNSHDLRWDNKEKYYGSFDLCFVRWFFKLSISERAVCSKISSVCILITIFIVPNIIFRRK